MEFADLARDVVTGPLRLGLIGLDSSHATTITRLLSTASGQERFGAVVALAWPGVASRDLEASHGRIDLITRQVCGDYGIPRADTPQEVAAGCDLVVITAVDARNHLELVERIAERQTPIFVDKPIATTLPDARAILARCAATATPVMSASAKRFAPTFAEARGMAGALISRVELLGPMPEQPPLSATFWYGVHLVELAYAALGTGCRRVRARTIDDRTHIDATWEGGRTATVQGTARWHAHTGGLLHHGDEVAPFHIDGQDPGLFAGLLETMIMFGRTGVSPVPADELEEVVAFMAAVDASLDQGREIAL